MFKFFKKKQAESTPAQVSDLLQDELIDRVVQAMGVSDDDTILEIGFGGPAAIQQLLPLLTQGRLAGIDRDARRVAEANALSPESFKSFKLEFKEGVVSRIPFTDEHFSKVFALDTVGTWLNIPKGLSEISRVLLPLGRVVFSLPPASRPQGEHVPPAEIRGLLLDAGFDNMEVLDAPDENASVIITAQKTFA